MKRQDKIQIGFKQDIGKRIKSVFRSRDISRPQFTSYRLNRDLRSNKMLESRSGQK